MPPPSYEREILRKLFENQDWYDLYNLHLEKLLSPAQIALTLNKLVGLEVVESNGLKARLTSYGREWVIRNRLSLFANTERGWAEPLVSSRPAHSRDEPYMPRLRSVDRKFFQNFD